VLTNDPRPVEGRLELSDRPGFGYELNEDAFAGDGRTVATIW
jgi:L-alanine-DL-glutamate epimerase-like enolase superfamily enzyme